MFAWIRCVWKTPDELILGNCGPDAFLFLRYISMMLRIFVPLMLIILPILASINARSGGIHDGALRRLSISNITPNYTTHRLWAHWVLAVSVVAWVCFIIHTETSSYAAMKQRYLRSRNNCFGTPSHIVLVGNIPKNLLNSEDLRRIFNVFQSGVKDVHINTDIKGLSTSLAKRKRILQHTEMAQTRYIVGSASKLNSGRSDSRKSPPWWPWRVLRLENKEAEMSEDTLTCNESREEKRTTRLPLQVCAWLPSLPHLGRKVDRIQHLLKCLDCLNQQVESFQTDVGNAPETGSALIQFHTQIAAHLAFQAVIHSSPHRMTPCIPEVDPKDIIWSNIALDWRQRWARTILGSVMSCGLIILYAIPVAFTSFLANLDTLASTVDWLSWISDWPEVIKSIIQGAIPPAILQSLLLLVPVVYRSIVQFQGAPTGSTREVQVQNWHFLFLFIQVRDPIVARIQLVGHDLRHCQVFLVVSISGSLISFLTGAAESPKSVSAELAQTLPKAANYFMSYVLIKALTGSGSALLQPYTLLVYCFSAILDVTPRQKWERQAKLATIEWARLFPPLTNIAVIGIAFSVVAPIVLIFVSLAFVLYWFVYRYNILYVYQYTFDSGGRFFISAMKQLFAGLYVMELCLIGIFFLARGPQGQPSCSAQAFAMTAVLLLTIAYHYFLRQTFEVLLHHLPVYGNVEAGVDGCIENLTAQLNATMSSPTVWIPRDTMGISAEECHAVRVSTGSVKISDDGAFLGNDRVVRISSCPPGYR
jgi:hypothetical protein